MKRFEELPQWDGNRVGDRDSHNRHETRCILYIVNCCHTIQPHCFPIHYFSPTAAYALSTAPSIIPDQQIFHFSCLQLFLEGWVGFKGSRYAAASYGLTPVEEINMESTSLFPSLYKNEANTCYLVHSELRQTEIQRHSRWFQPPYTNPTNHSSSCQPWHFYCFFPHQITVMKHIEEKIINNWA